MRLPYAPHLTSLARELRTNSTLAEVLLWKELKGRQRLGYDFHRQCPLDRYILDFFASELMLAIEIDGLSHDFKAEDDTRRQLQLEERGIHFLRFGDREVKRDPVWVAGQIDQWIAAHLDQGNSAGRKS
jgi:very-short-patch-repair endonuclease